MSQSVNLSGASMSQAVVSVFCAVSFVSVVLLLMCLIRSGGGWYFVPNRRIDRTVPGVCGFRGLDLGSQSVNGV